MVSEEQAYCSALLDHYATSWGSVEESHRWTKGPYTDLGPHFSVAQFSAANDSYAFATVGMSRVDRADPIELHILVSKEVREFDSLVELLTVVAHYHRTGAHLGLHHTVNFGRPWLPESSCSYGFISLPYLEGIVLERSDRVAARCLWLIPVTEAEVAFKRSHGAEALELAFESAELDYLNPARASVVEAPR